MHKDCSYLLIYDMRIEDLFKCLDFFVKSDGGDGGGAIVCKNYEEVANWFEEWYLQEHNHLKSMWPEKRFYPEHRMVNFHDNNENIIFTDDTDIKLFSHEYIYIVKTELIYGWYKNKDVVRKILPILDDWKNNESETHS